MKSVLVTGCSSGIGRCLAMGLKARGFDVLAGVRKPEDIDPLKQIGLQPIRLNLADTASIHAAVDEVLSQTKGQLYGLVNNAAYGLIGAVEDLPINALRDQFETNVFGTQELTNLIIPLMRKQNAGRIIQISSVLGLVSMRFRGAYSASKYALEALSDAMRYELSGTEIKLCLIEPGPIKSEFRNNAAAYFSKAIDKENSIHANEYHKMEGQAGNAVAFTFAPEAVLAKVLLALECRNPKARYYVTVPTYLLVFLKRFLPESLLDKILSRI